MAGEYPYRVCDLCGGVDDHPRHTLAGVTADAHPVDQSLYRTVLDNLHALFDSRTITFDQAEQVMVDFRDTTSQYRHIDCCAAAGCPTGTCQVAIDAHGGATGPALRESIMAGSQEG